MKAWDELWKREREAAHSAAYELHEAVKKRYLPRVQPRVFRIGPFVWPGAGGDLLTVWSETYRPSLRSLPLNEVAATPAEVRRAIEQLRRIRRWCEARLAGLKRAEEEIARQQAHHARWLERETAAEELAR